MVFTVSQRNVSYVTAKQMIKGVQPLTPEQKTKEEVTT